MSGTASGRRSEPAASTIALMSALPRRCEPGTTHSPFADVQPYSWAMKLKPWLPESRSGLSQCVQPSWCQATDPPRPGCLIQTASLNGTKSAPLTASATASSWGWPYTRRQAGENCNDPRTICSTRSGAPSGGSGSFIFAGWRPFAALGAAVRVRQRLDPADVVGPAVGAEGRAAVAVDRRHPW